MGDVERVEEQGAETASAVPTPSRLSASLLSITGRIGTES